MLSLCCADCKIRRKPLVKQAKWALSRLPIWLRQRRPSDACRYRLRHRRSVSAGCPRGGANAEHFRRAHGRSGGSRCQRAASCRSSRPTPLTCRCRRVRRACACDTVAAPPAPAPVVAAAPPAAAPSPAPPPPPAAAPPPPPQMVAQARPAPAAPPRAAAPTVCPGNPNALGVSRTVEIDTTGGPGFRIRTFQAVRLPQTRRSRADVRRRSLAKQHADGAGSSRRTTASRRRFSRSASTRPTIRKFSSRSLPPAHTIGSHTWSHVRSGEERHVGRRRQGGNRNGHQRRPHGGRRRHGAVLPFPGAATSAGSWSPILGSATSRSSRPTWTRSISRCTSPSRSSNPCWKN